jgi:hypothetical protein
MILGIVLGSFLSSVLGGSFVGDTGRFAMALNI